MQLITQLKYLDTVPAGLSYAIGNFDGFHLGHQALLESAKKYGPLGVITFEPHPKEFFNPALPPFRLTRARDKRAIAQDLGVDAYIELSFNADFSGMQVQDFHQYVLAPLRPKCLVLGYDFHYGKGRLGNAQNLKQAGFDIQVLAPVLDESQQNYSSSRVRKAIEGGDFHKAAQMLGRYWCISGEVEQGDKVGRTIGFPTANLHLAALLRPPIGIYACWVQIEKENVLRPGAAYYGNRPAVDGKDTRFEVHLLDFNADLYGRQLKVQIVEYIRGDQNFASLEAMSAQIMRDCDKARQILRKSCQVLRKS